MQNPPGAPYLGGAVAHLVDGKALTKKQKAEDLIEDLEAEREAHAAEIASYDKLIERLREIAEEL